MDNINKPRSPFYPGQPVPVDLFAGRLDQIGRIKRSIRQVELGKPQAVFLTGEYGIGKSSLAGFMRFLAEKENNIVSIHVLLGGVTNLEQMALKTVESAIHGQSYEPSNTERIRNFFAKYIGKQEFFGVSINFDALRADAPNLSRGYLPFLRGFYDRLKDNNTKGVMLVLDEINGIAANPDFAHFLKGLVDDNALSNNPIPLMLIMCGVKERLGEMIRHHQPVERIFDIVEISPMSKSEMRNFFNNSFGTAGISVTDDAMEILCHYSAGFPKIMHIIGESTFWVDKDNKIDREDALTGVVIAADEVGKKFVDQQIIMALKSKDFRAILAKLGKSEFVDLSFTKAMMEKGLSETERKKFNNFLQRMKRMKVIRSGDDRGEYIFNSRLVRTYLLLNTSKFD